jgi:hypothetical protein
MLVKLTNVLHLYLAHPVLLILYKMNYYTQIPMPTYPSHFTLRLFLDGPEPRRRVSTAVFLKDSGKVFQVFKAIRRGDEHHQTFNTVGDWIQSVMAIHKCRLVLEGINKSILQNEFRPVMIIPVVNTTDPIKMSQKAILERMTELLKQKQQITNELTSLMAQITA